MEEMSQIQEMKNRAQRASNEAIPWVERLARFGYAAKGVVYFTMGLLAVQVAIGSGGRTTGPSGALDSIASNPLGMLLLGLVAIGLLGYALWRFVQAWIDPENEGSDAKGIAKRIGYATSTSRRKWGDSFQAASTRDP